MKATVSPLLALAGVLLFAGADSRLGAADIDPEYEVKRSLAARMAQLSTQVESTIHQIERNERKIEHVEARRYFVGNIEGGAHHDLVTFVSFESGTGNDEMWDLVLVLASSPDHPIVKQLGEIGDREVESISIRGEAILVNFLYYGADDALCCPSIKRQGRFAVRGGQLIETTPRPFPPRL